MTKSMVKRKTLIIKRGMQTRFVFMVSVFVLVAVSAIGVDFYFHFGRDIQNFMDPGLYQMFRSDSWIFLLKLVVYMVGVVIFSVFASHKLAGPIYRFERSAHTVGTGDLTHRVSIRTGDDMEEFKDEFNLMTESLQRLVSKDVETTVRVSKVLDTLLAGNPLPADTTVRLQEIKSEVESLHKGFKI